MPKLKRDNPRKVPEPLCVTTCQKSVPIIGIHDRYNLIETREGCYVRLYKIKDINYITSPEEEQQAIFLGWRRVLNSFGDNMEAALTIYNRTIKEDAFREDVLMKETGDAYDALRKEINQIILDRAKDGKNNIEKEKYLTIAIHADTAKKASEAMHRMDTQLGDAFSKIKSEATPVEIEDALEILYSIYSDSDEPLILSTRIMDDEGILRDVKSFDFDVMRQAGLRINDLIAPSSLEIRRDRIMLGNKFCRVLRVSEFPSDMADEFLNNVTDLPFHCLTTINYEPMNPREAARLVQKNLTLVRDEKHRQMKKGQQEGIYDDSAVASGIIDRENEALALRADMHERDEKLFSVTLSVMVFADTLEQLDSYTETVRVAYQRLSANLQVMVECQEEGLNATLPLCYNQIKEKRTLKSTSCAIMLPFSNLELCDAGGVNYSCNLYTKNLIVYNRLNGSNFNGFILGTPGSGKSFTAKLEMLQQFLKTRCDIIIIDPENEYAPLVKMLGGQVIDIKPSGSSHINPLEISDWDYDSDDGDPINSKAEFMLRFTEVIYKSPFGLSSTQETIIDECVHALYKPFLDEHGRLGLITPETAPTLNELQELLAARPEMEAHELAMAYKLYSGDGSLNVFSYHANVDINNRMVVFQIKDVSERLKKLAMLTLMETSWGRIKSNRKIGRNTWLYCDEIHLLFQDELTTSYLDSIYRRSRKYGAGVTGLSQNISAILESPAACSMLQNSNFVQVLNQATPDRIRLQEVLNLSESQAEVVTNAPKGQGLIYNGKDVIPVYSKFPNDTKCYRVLTSDLREIKAFEAQEKREAARAEKTKLEQMDAETNMESADVAS